MKTERRASEVRKEMWTIFKYILRGYTPFWISDPEQIWSFKSSKEILFIFRIKDQFRAAEIFRGTKNPYMISRYFI